MDLYDLLEFDPDDARYDLNRMSRTNRIKAALAARHLVDIIQGVQQAKGDFEPLDTASKADAS
jgi:hypothetical protein